MASTGSSKAMDLLEQFTSLAGENATPANIKAASAYADNPYTQVMIDANSPAVVRNLNEETLPGIDRPATATGRLTKIGRAHVVTPDTNAPLVSRLLLDNKKTLH